MGLRFIRIVRDHVESIAPSLVYRHLYKPVINAQASEYWDLIKMFRNGPHSPLEYHTVENGVQRVSEPLWTQQYSLEELQNMSNAGPIRTEFSCHTQAVERAVKDTSTHVASNYGYRRQLLATLNSQQHRSFMPGNVKRPKMQ